MTNIIQKILAKQELTEADYDKLKAWKQPDTKALTDEIDALKAKLAVEKTAKDQGGAALEEIKAQVANLTKAVETERKARLTAEAEAKTMKRAQAIDGLRSKHGINFVDGIDPAITRGAFEKAFEGIEDFADEAKVTEAITNFRKANSGLIRAANGPGGSFGGGAATPLATGGQSDTAAMAKMLADAGVVRTSAK